MSAYKRSVVGIYHGGLTGSTSYGVDFHSNFSLNLSLSLFLSFSLFSFYSKTQPPEQNNCLKWQMLRSGGM